MMATGIRNVAMLFSLVVLCAALIGCSSSDDGRVAELEEQLNMAEVARMTAELAQTAAEAAQMTAEHERDAAKAAQMTADQERATAEQALINARVSLAAADKIRDATSLNLGKVDDDGGNPYRVAHFYPDQKYRVQVHLPIAVLPCRESGRGCGVVRRGWKFGIQCSGRSGSQAFAIRSRYLALVEH